MFDLQTFTKKSHWNPFLISACIDDLQPAHTILWWSSAPEAVQSAHNGFAKTVKGAETKTRWRSCAGISRDKLSIKTEILGKPGIIVKAPIVTPRKHDLFLYIQKATD